MTNPVLVPFHVEHLLAFEDRDKWTRGDWSAALLKERAGPAWTALSPDDGAVLGCAGVALAWPGVGMAWVSLAQDMTRYRVWMTRTIRRVLDDIIRAHDLHRVEAVVLASQGGYQQWIRVLGFTVEQGRARKYDPDQRDVLRFERVRD